jgi:DNA invertase Pin-like site-specific DNA recombinase
VKWVADPAMSGALPAVDRPGLTDALALLRDGSADGLIVRDLDRLARAVTVQEAILAEVWNRLGGRVFEATGEVLRDDPDDPMRTAMREMAGVFAGLERRLVVKRLRDGRAEKARQGGHAVGRPPYGWTTPARPARARARRAESTPPDAGARRRRHLEARDRGDPGRPGPPDQARRLVVEPDRRPHPHPPVRRVAQPDRPGAGSARPTEEPMAHIRKIETNQRRNGKPVAHYEVRWTEVYIGSDSARKKRHKQETLPTKADEGRRRGAARRDRERARGNRGGDGPRSATGAVRGVRGGVVGLVDRDGEGADARRVRAAVPDVRRPRVRRPRDRLRYDG